MSRHSRAGANLGKANAYQSSSLVDSGRKRLFVLLLLYFSPVIIKEFSCRFFLPPGPSPGCVIHHLWGDSGVSGNLIAPSDDLRLMIAAAGPLDRVRQLHLPSTASGDVFMR